MLLNISLRKYLTERFIRYRFNKSTKIIPLIIPCVHSNNLINIIQFHDNRRSTLPLRSLNIIILYYPAFLLSFNNFQSSEHRNLRISFLNIFLLFSWVSANSDFKFSHFILIYQSLLIKREEINFLEVI